MIRSKLSKIFAMHAFTIFMLGLFLTTCKTDSDDCKSSFDNGSRQLNLYYKSKQARHLDTSLIYFNRAIQCDSFRAAAIERKVAVLILLKNFSKASEFVDSLESKVFLKPYTRQMYLLVLRGYNAEASRDSAGYRAQIKAAVKLLEKFIESSVEEKKVDQQAYYDLFFLKSKIYSKSQIETELSKLAEYNRSDAAFFNSLKSTFFEN